MENNYQSILEYAEMSAYILNESTFNARSTTWTYAINKAKEEWKMYAPELIDVAKSEPTVSNFNDFKMKIKKLNKLVDSDGKESLLGFVELIEMQNFKDEFPNYEGNNGVIDAFFKLFLNALEII